MVPVAFLCGSSSAAPRRSAARNATARRSGLRIPVGARVEQAGISAMLPDQPGYNGVLDVKRVEAAKPTSVRSTGSPAHPPPGENHGAPIRRSFRQLKGLARALSHVFGHFRDRIAGHARPEAQCDRTTAEIRRRADPRRDFCKVAKAAAKPRLPLPAGCGHVGCPKQTPRIGATQNPGRPPIGRVAAVPLTADRCRFRPARLARLACEFVRATAHDRLAALLLSMEAVAQTRAVVRE